MNLLLVLTFVILKVNLLSAELCNGFKTCGDCISSARGCVWCTAKNHTLPRCEASTILERYESWCNGSVKNPKHDWKILKNYDFRSANGTVQFRPQNISIKAHPGIPVVFNMSYKPAEDYPLDIYYLMDNSYTMERHREKLRDQAKKIYNVLTNITNNVRFGVGSFVEKFAFPYASPILHGAYDFENHLPLTDDISQFVRIVGSVVSQGNYDIPEAGLDALMQAMVCTEIDWRSDARRIIVLSTDSTYHSAGDGKMVGAFKQNDMKCHLQNKIYDLTLSLLYDYPSVSQINKVAKDKEITIIFAALRVVEDVYRALSNKIQGAKYAELSDSAEIAPMIKAEYESLVQNLKITLESTLPPHIQLKLNPPCTVSVPCTYTPGGHVDIEATLIITNCPADQQYKTLIEIGPEGLHERLMIKVEVDCQCDCEKDGHRIVNSLMCNSVGVYQCGVCKCNRGRYGDTCECTGMLTIEKAKDKCKVNKNDTDVCSGRGECRCGECINCETNFNGTYCEFSDLDCPFYLNKPCGGKGRGYCLNETCHCQKGWIGHDCSCPDDTACLAPNGKMCSDHGVCQCGQCECGVNTTKTYSGKYCNFCEDCAEERCVELADYVECYFNLQDQRTCDSELNHTSNYMILMMNRTEMNSPEWRTAYRCIRTLQSGTMIIFKYIDNNDTMILIQKEQELPVAANVWVAVGSAVGAILLIGLLTVIIWKILVDIHDHREYDKFATECAAAGFDVLSNPLYQPPATNINNPMYNFGQ